MAEQQPPKLSVLLEKMRGKSFVLDKPEMTAGRKDAMDICIKDPSLSGHHCTFVRTDHGTYILRDNDSTNGTRVNNIPITEQELKHSDVIQLGGVEIYYDHSASAGTAGSATSSSFGRTHTINLESLETNVSTVRDLANYSPFAQTEVKKQARTHQIMLVFLGLLGLAAVGVVAYLLYRVFFAAAE